MKATKRRANFRARNGGLAACLAPALLCAASGAAANDFPTSARAEFVFACMSTNGQHKSLISISTLSGGIY